MCIRDRKEAVLTAVMNYLRDPNAAAYRDLSQEMQAYINYISSDLLTLAVEILDSDAIDTTDEIYEQWTTDETINLYTYLNHAISQNWIDTTKLLSLIHISRKEKMFWLFPGKYYILFFLRKGF